MNIGLICSGGREHAICKKLSESPKIKNIYCFPGNAGTLKYAINIVSRWTDNYYHFLIESIPRLIIMLKEQSTILNKILNEKDVNHKMKKYDKKIR